MTNLGYLIGLLCAVFVLWIASGVIIRGSCRDIKLYRSKMREDGDSTHWNEKIRESKRTIRFLLFLAILATLPSLHVMWTYLKLLTVAL